MSWLSDLLHHPDHCDDPHIRALVIALAKLEKTMVLDLSKLQSQVSAQGGLITSVQAEVTALQAGSGSSVDQVAVDALATSVEANNSALQAILTPASS